MKKIENYKLFEAKSKTDWEQKLKDKLKEFKKLIDDNPVIKGIDNKELLETILIDLNDFTEYKYFEYLLIQNEDNNKNIDILLTEDGSMLSHFYDERGRSYAYSEYMKISKFLDKNRFSKNMCFYYYIRLIPKNHWNQKKERYNQEFFDEVENKKIILKSMGFIIHSSNHPGDDTIYAKILLNNVDINLKYIDLSDLVSDNIVDDFEKFIISKNLSRTDAEEIVKIFSFNK
jgi:hypothetical protein